MPQFLFFENKNTKSNLVIKLNLEDHLSIIIYNAKNC